MDPVRAMIHLGLKATEATLDRALDVVRLADTLLAATAVQPLRERDADSAAWPDEEQADLDALSATLRARGGGASLREDGETTTAPVSGTAKKTTTRTGKKSPAAARPAKKASTTATPVEKAVKRAPARETSAPAASVKKVATKAPAKKPAKKAPAKKPAKRAPAKKAPAQKTAAKGATGTASSPTSSTPDVRADD